MAPAMMQANVVGVKKDGTYTVDQWGSKIQVVKIPDELGYHIDKDNPTLLRAGI
jgi:hypothetical protein